MKKVFQGKIKKYQAKNILFIANFLNGLNKKLKKNKDRHKKTGLLTGAIFVRLTRFERATSTSAGWRSNPTELQSQTV